MDEKVIICTAILPQGNQCGHIMRRYETGDGGFYFICEKCGNMLG